MDSTFLNKFKFYQTLKEKSGLVQEIAQRYGYFINEYPVKMTKTSYGKENPDKTFYVIGGILDETAGLFAFVQAIFWHCLYAEEKGYIPVVDMKNFNNQYSEDKPDNAWEFFFEQPAGYNLEMIKHSKNIILSKPKTKPNYKFPAMVNPSKIDKRIDRFQSSFRKYIKLNTISQDLADNTYKQLINNNDKILGILCRGTDYQYLRPRFHAIQPSAQEVIAKAKLVIKEHGCTKIFLATEDADILKQFKGEFGGIIVYNQQRLYQIEELKGADFLSSLKDESKRQVALQYLSSIYILSKCDCFIAGQTAGSLGAYLMADRYEYSYLWNIGKY
ncbi:MAG: hypothetical protein ACK5MI_08755 [Mangrovibacterium sp.]